MTPIFNTRSISVLAVILSICVSAGAHQTRVYFFDEPAAFGAASKGVRTVDFEAVAPGKGFGKYAPDVGLNAAGVRFKASGGGKFGPGMIYVPSADYTRANPGLKMLDGAHVSWSPPNQPGNASLELLFPPGVRAVGANLWTLQPAASPIQITVVTRDGSSHTSTVTTKNRPDKAFCGVVSEAEIATVRLTLAKGQSGLMMDDLAFGAKADGVDLAEISTVPVEGPRRDVADVGRPEPSTGRKPEPATSESSAQVERPIKTSPGPIGKTGKSPLSAANNKQFSGGDIYYVRADKEIRAVSPEGKNDRQFWTHPDAHEGLGINELAWSPDGSELAFSSSHESVASFYHADLYAIKPDGTGLRKITNRPDRSDYPKYRKGIVTVTVRNDQPIYLSSKASEGIFFVYVVGADLPQPITLPPGSSRTLTFKDVADFGEHAQPVVAINAGTRWMIPGTDVQAGKVVKAPDFGISGDGLPLFGAFRPVWKHDGSTLSYRSGLCVVSSIASRPPVGHSFDPLFKGSKPPAPCAWDWGPTAETADQLIYFVDGSDDITIYRITGTGQHPGEKLVSFPKEEFYFLRDLRWLPDASGFLFSVAEFAKEAGNIYRYDLGTRKTSKVTALTEGFARAFTISPDGKFVVFERTEKFIDDKADLWITGLDGRGTRMLVQNAYHPSWRR